jgi:hypothetical protein
MQADIDAMIEATERGDIHETTADVFDYFLDVLPPVSMGKAYEIPGRGTIRTSFGFAEGYERVRAFWEEDGKFYVYLTRKMNPYAGG